MIDPTAPAVDGGPGPSSPAPAWTPPAWTPPAGDTPASATPAAPVTAGWKPPASDTPVQQSPAPQASRWTPPAGDAPVPKQAPTALSPEIQQQLAEDSQRSALIAGGLDRTQNQGSFENFGNALGRTIARPIEGIAGLVDPAYGQFMRQRSDAAYPSATGKATSAGQFVGQMANAPYALTPAGRALSAAEAAGNSRINTADARSQGKTVSRLDEFANATGSAGLDLAANVTANKLLGKTVGGLGKALAPGLAEAAISGNANAMTQQIVKALAARMGVEVIGNDLIGRAHTLAQNLVNKVTTNPDQKITEGQGWENEVNALLQTVVMSGITAPHAIGEAKTNAMDIVNRDAPLFADHANAKLFPRGNPATPPSNVPTPPDAKTLASLKTAKPGDTPNVPSDTGLPASAEDGKVVPETGQSDVPQAEGKNSGGDGSVPARVEESSGLPEEAPAKAEAAPEGPATDAGVDDGQTGNALVDAASPRHRITDGGESRGVELDFADPDDKALYLATVPRKGKVAVEAAKYLAEQGYKPEDIARYGDEVRGRVEDAAKIPPGDGLPLHIEGKGDLPAPSDMLPEKPTTRTPTDDTLESAVKGAYRVTSGLGEHQEVLDVHKELTGQEAVPYAGGRGRGFRSEGQTFYNVEKNNTPQLRREAIAHEATHALQDTRPDLVHQLDDAIPLATREKLLDEYRESYQRQEGKPLDPKQNAREIQAMAVGRAFSRESVAREVMQNDPGVFRRGADAIITKLRGLTSGGKLTNSIVKFLRAAREQAATNGPATDKTSFLPEHYDEESRQRDNERLSQQIGSKVGEGQPQAKPMPEGPPQTQVDRYRALQQWARDHGQPVPKLTPELHAEATPDKAPADFLPGQATAKKFVDEDVRPRLQAAGEAVSKAWEGTKNLLGMQNTSDAQRAKGILRERGAELANRTDRLVEAFKQSKEAFDEVPVAETRDFIDQMEKGKLQTDPKLQPIADALRGLLDDRLKQVQARGKLTNFIQDYFPHLWKNPAKAAGVFSGEGRSPMEGAKSFLRQRSLPLFSDGIAKGLEPVTENPVEASMLRVREMDKFITAHDALEEMKSPIGPGGPVSPLLKRVPARGAVPEGYAKINDSAGTIYAAPNRKGGVSIAGFYVAPEAVASVINNNLSPGLRGDPHFGGLFRGYLGAGNVINQSTLGLSAFHAATSTFNSALSEFGMGTKALFAGRVGEASKRIGNSLTVAGPAARDFWQGTQLLKEWKKPGSTTPELAMMVDAMKAGGGRAGMDTFYHTGMTDKMMTAFRQGNTVGGIMRLPMAGLEQAAKPIMEYLVPRLKMGAFMQMAQHEMAGNPGMDHDELRSKMGDVWNSVDNRFGQMVQDNVFWNRTVKDLAMASVRSVGWNLGTFRELGGGIKDFATMGKRLAMDRSFNNVEYTHRMAYTVALPVLSGLIGGVVHYAMTGEKPGETKDLFFPKTGSKDANGDDTRYALPTYMKDVYGFAHNPASTVANKAHPMLGTIMDMLANKDYFGTKIRNEDDPIMKQAMDELKFAGKQTLPISLKDVGQFGKEGTGAGKALLPMVGLTHAPSYITRSPAENLASQLEAERLPRGSRTQAAVDKSNEVRSLADLVKNHDSTAFAKIRAAVQGGQIGEADIQNIRDRQKYPTALAHNVSHLDMPAAMKVWEEASDDEKQKIGPLLFTKLRGSKALSRDERVGYMKTLQADWTRLKGVPQ